MNITSRMQFASPARRAFTLIEILVVVVILGILAAIVVPQVSSAADVARESSMQMSLKRIREQILIYKEHHGGDYPSLANFADQMTMGTNANGDTAAMGTSGYPFGGYLNRVPDNPQTDSNDIGNGAIGSSAWYYDESTGEFRANDSAESAAF